MRSNLAYATICLDKYKNIIMKVVLNMIDGNVNEFVDHIQYGDELWFIYDNKKYFLEGLPENGVCKLFLYEIEKDIKWVDC